MTPTQEELISVIRPALEDVRKQAVANCAAGPWIPASIPPSENGWYIVWSAKGRVAYDAEYRDGRWYDMECSECGHVYEIGEKDHENSVVFWAKTQRPPL